MILQVITPNIYLLPNFMGILPNFEQKVKGNVKKQPLRHSVRSPKDEDTKKWMSGARIFNGFASGLLFLCALVSL
jgi:hypothetical protein